MCFYSLKNRFPAPRTTTHHPQWTQRLRSVTQRKQISTDFICRGDTDFCHHYMHEGGTCMASKWKDKLQHHWFSHINCWRVKKCFISLLKFKRSDFRTQVWTSELHRTNIKRSTESGANKSKSLFCHFLFLCELPLCCDFMQMRG